VSPPRALLVDLDGVIRHFPAPHAIEREARLPAGAILAAAFAPARLTPAITGLVSDEQWRAQVAGELQALYPASDAAGAVRRWSGTGQLDAAVLDLVRRARRRALIVLVTNATSRLGADLDVLGLTPELDVVVSSALIGVAKPSAAYFRRALELAGVAAAEALFVDDSERNVDAARALGIASLRFTDPLALERELTSRGIIVRAEPPCPDGPINCWLARPG
jgi:putative hydrolase of the HAD superfamily